MKTYGLASILFATALASTSLVGKAAELKEFHHRLMMPSPHATTNSLVIVATDLNGDNAAKSRRPPLRPDSVPAATFSQRRDCWYRETPRHTH